MAMVCYALSSLIVKGANVAKYRLAIKTKGPLCLDNDVVANRVLTWVATLTLHG